MSDPINIAFGVVGSSAGARLHLDVVQTIDSGLPPLEVNTAAFTVEPYVIIDGVPHGDGAGLKVHSTAGADAVTQVLTPLDPETLFLDARAHWIPKVVYLDPPSGSSRRWWPVGGVHDADHPRMSLSSIAGATGAGAFATATSPYIHVGYSYQGNGRKMSRPAMVFENDHARAKIDPEASFESCTLGITAVYHPGSQPYFGIFEAQQVYDPSSSSPVGEPLVLRYTHGRIDLYQDQDRVLSHETNKPSAYPVILLLSLDSVSEVGRMLCLDQTRTTRTFNTSDMDFISLLGSVGALGQGTAASPYRYGAEMDLLDWVIWGHAMDWPELDSSANLLALAYT